MSRRRSGFDNHEFEFAAVPAFEVNNSLNGARSVHASRGHLMCFFVWNATVLMCNLAMPRFPKFMFAFLKLHPRTVLSHALRQTRKVRRTGRSEAGKCQGCFIVHTMTLSFIPSAAQSFTCGCEAYGSLSCPLAPIAVCSCAADVYV